MEIEVEKSSRRFKDDLFNDSRISNREIIDIEIKKRRSFARKENLTKILQMKIEMPITKEILNKLVIKGKVFLRSIEDPFALSFRSKHGETNWEMELRKVSREIGIKTCSSKEDNILKNGNPNRSVTMAYKGVKVYEKEGYGIVSPDLKDIKAVTYDMNYLWSGFGKKKDSEKKLIRDLVIDQKLPMKDRLNQLLEYLKEAKGSEFEINEILMDIHKKNINFIYYINECGYKIAKDMQSKASEYLKKEVPIFRYLEETGKFE